MKIIQIISSVSNMSAGPTHSVGALAEYLNTLGNNVVVKAYGPIPKKWQYNVTLDNTYGFLEKIKLISIPSIINIRKDSKSFEIMHCHGVWRVANLFSLFLPNKIKSKIVWSPRGMFSDWSWNYHSSIKKIMWNTVQNRAVSRTECFHATAKSEYIDIRNRGFKQPVAIIPNGVNLPFLDNPIKEKTIVFMSRIHEKKGLELLINTWMKIEKKYLDWDVKIAGPLDSNYAQSLQNYVRESNIPRIKFLGQVLSEEKTKLLSTASLFVLPSYSENFGIVIAESLAHSTPVITTKETPWEGLIKNNCGWWGDASEEFIEKSLLEALSMSHDELAEMGLRGRVWMENDYSWDAITNNMLLLYQWLANDAPKPAFVITD